MLEDFTFEQVLHKGIPWGLDQCKHLPQRLATLNTRDLTLTPPSWFYHSFVFLTRLSWASTDHAVHVAITETTQRTTQQVVRLLHSLRDAHCQLVADSALKDAYADCFIGRADLTLTVFKLHQISTRHLLR
jgi:hypothetical protein